MANDVGGSPYCERRFVPRWLVRSLIVAVGLGLWFFTQSLLGSRSLSPGDDVGGAMLSRTDGLFVLTQPINEFLHARPEWANGLLIFSSAVIDVLGIGLILCSVFGPTMRPFIGLLILFAMRQLMQTICVLPTPAGMIWRYPGFPSLLVTYHVANDFFFSGHTAIAVFGATQVARIPRRGMLTLGVAIAALEIATVIVLRAHYTMDVYAGAITALWAALAADRVAPYVDRAIE
jgi:membrane-associated phospholipid phosphatase